MKNIYIILMNTGTIPGTMIRYFTRYKYSHVVLSLNDSYTKLYSFGRKTLHNFLNGGLVTYGIDSKFFKKFNNTQCAIYELSISKSQYSNIKKVLSNYEKHMDMYKYDMKGFFIRYFYNPKYAREKYFVCSEFIAQVLKEAEIYDFGKPVAMIRPKDFIDMKGLNKIYEGLFLNSKSI